MTTLQNSERKPQQEEEKEKEKKRTIGPPLFSAVTPFMKTIHATIAQTSNI